MRPPPARRRPASQTSRVRRAGWQAPCRALRRRRARRARLPPRTGRSSQGLAPGTRREGTRPSWPAGISSCRMPALRGSVPAAQPCSIRPASKRVSDFATALSTDPQTSRARLPSSARRLPYMSPARPATGVLTAADSSVVVRVQPAAEGVVPSRRGSEGITGTGSTLISGTSAEQSASVQTILRAPGRVWVSACALGSVPGRRTQACSMRARPLIVGSLINPARDSCTPNFSRIRLSTRTAVSEFPP